MATNITYKGSELASFSNNTKTLKTAGKYLEGDITITAGLDVNNQNKTVIPSETTQSITADSGYSGLGTVTVNGITNTYVGSSVPVNGTSMINGSVSYDASSNRYVQTLTGFEGYYPVAASRSVGGDFDGIKWLPKQEATTIVPSETAQTAVDIHKWTTGTVTVAAITPTYVGSGITTNPTITVSGRTVTIPAGYYDSDKEQAVNRTMLVTASDTSTGVLWNTIRVGYTQTYINFSEGYNDNARYARVWSYAQSKTVTPTTQTQTVKPDSNYDTLKSVTVEPIPSQYIVPSGTLTITSVDTTTTFDAKSYASVAVNLKNADVTAY